jgi:hypothetical protein
MKPPAGSTREPPAPRRTRRRALDVAERFPYRLVVRSPDSLADVDVAEREEHAHALRRRERQVVARDPDRHPRRAQLPALVVLARQHQPQRLAVDHALETELAHTGAEPFATRLGAADVVLLRPVADTLDHVNPLARPVEVVPVLPGRELADRQHDVSAQAAGTPVGTGTSGSRHVL